MNIVILGGGSAGWLTALLSREFYLRHKITVIESAEIGIAGVGESTVPHIISVLDTIGIPVSDLVKHCGATIKTGIRFENWNGDGKDYFHPFHGNPGVSLSNCDLGDYFLNLSQTKEIASGQRMSAISDLLSQECKVPFSYANRIDQQSRDPILKLQNHASFALHFNTQELALFLRRVAEDRNISRVEGKLARVNTDADGNITQLVLENETVVDADFVFDCSGFARLLIGKHFNTPWISYKKHLPMKAAVPFFIPHDNENIRPDTACIAMKYGWMWQIPVQNRYGCGYVYDSDYITREEALAEVEEYWEQSIDSPKSFSFDAGMFENTLVKNCMAVGLAQGFIEPLESTSIMINCMNTLQFLQHNGACIRSEKFAKFFNEECRARNNEVMNFVFLHYLTKRNDSEFWQELRSKVEIPKEVADRLELWNDIVPSEYFNPKQVFSLGSWLHVANGLGLLNLVTFAHKMIEQSIDQRMTNRYNDYISNLDLVAKGCLTHKEFIDFLKTN